jgi:hypothetical protein
VVDPVRAAQPADLPGLAAAGSCEPTCRSALRQSTDAPAVRPAAAIAALSRPAFIWATGRWPTVASSAATTTATGTMNALVSDQVTGAASR